MAIVGHAASRNIFLEMPLFIRGLSQSMYGKVGPKQITLCARLLKEIQNVDHLDPTSTVDQYLFGWWNHEKDWKTYSLDVDHQLAFKWHIRKVREIFFFCPPVNICPYRQYGHHKTSGSQDLTPLLESSTENTCTSDLCRARLHEVLAQVKKATLITESMGTALGDEAISAARQILSLKTLNDYRLEKGKARLEDEDVRKLFEEGFGRVEKPDVEMQDDSLTSQSLSFTGFSDSDSDYIPP
jgi:hypothetical protein